MKKPVLALAALCLSSVLHAQDAPPAPEVNMNYAFGILLGQSLAQTHLTFDLNEVMHGLKDSLGQGGPAKLDAEQAKQIVTQALQAAQAQADAANTAKENVWLTQHAAVSGVTTTASGLQYEVLKAGSSVKPSETDVVKVDYVGKLIDGTEFDSSAKQGQPAVFPVNQVIPAWTEGLQLMGVGAKYRFTIPSKLAYGAEGAGNGIIPPYSTLIFEVELLSIEPPEASPTPEPQPQ